MNNEPDDITEDEDNSIYVFLDDVEGYPRYYDVQNMMADAINKAIEPFGYKVRARMNGFRVLESYVVGMRKILDKHQELLSNK